MGDILKVRHLPDTPEKIKLSNSFSVIWSHTLIFGYLVIGFIGFAIFTHWYIDLSVARMVKSVNESKNL